MKLDKILRVLVCLALVCCLLTHMMIPRANATGLVESISAIGTVLGPVGTVAAVSVIALGLWAGANPDDFDNVVDGVSTHLSEIGSNMKDGFVQMLQVTDSAGAKQLYVAAETLENVRSYLFDSGTVSSIMGLSATHSNLGYPYLWSDTPFACVTFTCSEKDTYFQGIVSQSPCTVYRGYEYGDTFSSTELKSTSSGCPYNGYYWNGGYGSGAVPDVYSTYLYLGDFSQDQLKQYQYYNYSWSGAFRYIVKHVPLSFASSYDVSLGVVSNTSIVDDVSVYDSAWNSNQLRVAVADPENNEPNYKVYFPVPLPSNYEDLHSVTQSDVLTGAITGVPDLGEDEEYVIEELPIVDGYQGVIVSPSDTQSGTQSGTTTGAVTLPGWLSDGINNLLQGLKDILNTLLSLPAALWAALPAWLTEGISNMVTGLRDILDAINALPVAIAEALAAIFVPSADYITAKVEALRGEFGFIDSVIATGEFIRDSISGDSGPPVIFVDLGRAPSGNYGSQRVLLTDFSWYAPYKGQVDTVLSAALWAFFGWRVFMKLPGIIGGESGYISDVFFSSSSGRSGSDDKKKGGKG